MLTSAAAVLFLCIFAHKGYRKRSKYQFSQQISVVLLLFLLEHLKLLRLTHVDYPIQLQLLFHSFNQDLNPVTEEVITKH